MDGKQFHIRTLTVAAVLAVLLAVFAGVLYYLQIVRGEEYRAASTVRNVNVETVEAARGELLDRYGRTLVSNRATYEIVLETSRMGKEPERNAILLELIAIYRENGLTDCLSGLHSHSREVFNGIISFSCCSRASDWCGRRLHYNGAFRTAGSLRRPSRRIDHRAGKHPRSV